MAVDYEYDVFLSYRRHSQWPDWVRGHFHPLFHHWLGEELGVEARIFVDYEIQTGDAWPARLALALSRSKALVCLWSPMYFSSSWCTAELAHMYARERLCGYRTVEQPGGLIVPAALHDGDSFPAEARMIQQAQLQTCANTRIAPHSLRAEELEQRIRDWVPDVRSAVLRAPKLDPAWVGMATDEFLRVLRIAEPQQTVLPGLTSN